MLKITLTSDEKPTVQFSGSSQQLAIDVVTIASRVADTTGCDLLEMIVELAREMEQEDPQKELAEKFMKRFLDFASRVLEENDDTN